MEPLIVANWKSNKTSLQTKDWLAEISNLKSQISNKQIIICPSFTLLPILKEKADELGIKLGAQNISPFETGSFTGEINGTQIKEFADYVIIGHSERRKNFHEDEGMIKSKIEMAQKHKLIPILCISNLEQIQSSVRQLADQISNLKLIVAYEPLFAIGSANPDTPENASIISSKIKEELGDVTVLYGGSVDSQNVSSFTKMPNIDGVLVGSGSLDVLEFVDIIKNA